ncbi:MAG: preprotein translocase subunit SecA, partial [Bacilli bacterium]
MKILKKLFDHEYKELSRFIKIADKIEAMDLDMQKLSDAQLKENTVKLKGKVANGADIEDVLVEAFATAREAAFRVIGEKPFYVQLLGGL